MRRRGFWVYLTLAAVWLILIFWQWGEHKRVVAAARATLMDRARAITSTLGLVIRSERRFRGFIYQDRLQAALQELIKPGELESIALLNGAGDKVVSAGAEMDEVAIHARSGVTWTSKAMILANLVDLGVSTNEAARGLFAVPPSGVSGLASTNSSVVADRATNQPSAEKLTNQLTSSEKSTNAEETASASSPPLDTARRLDPVDRRPPSLRNMFRRPPSMGEEEYRALLAKQGLHSFVIMMSTLTVENETARDLELRGIICFLATLSVAGAGVGWRNTKRSTELGLRLVKASEMNMHLKQMNLAAAGLAHETRNPLNIVRGLAQMISKESSVPDEVRAKSQAIMMETDRVTAQLNEFINYSRPREVRQSPVAIARVVQDVVQTLLYDAQEKHILIATQPSELLIQADEQLLRQALFNLTLNAIQAVEPGGSIQINILSPAGPEASLEIRDSGPGVPEERRTDVFKPYFTTQPQGTGLGLAIVQQIILAHGWEISCGSNEPRGACFKIKHLRVVS